MRRIDKQIDSLEEINKIIHRSNVCWVAMARKNNPYLIPMNFGFQDQHLYLHSAGKGLKIDILKENPRVCIAFGQNIELLPSTILCKTSMKYQSVLVYGKARFIEDPHEKKEALDIIVRHYYKDKTEDVLKYNHKTIIELVIIKIQIEKMTGKKSL